MMTRIPQRTQMDCVSCTVAMAMGLPYTYERVLSDSQRYEQVSLDGKFLAWWGLYLRDEGFECVYCQFEGLFALRTRGSETVGILGMDVPRLKSGHIVAVDELGVADPATNAPERVEIVDYIRSVFDGVVFHKEWLAVRKQRGVSR